MILRVLTDSRPRTVPSVPPCSRAGGARVGFRPAEDEDVRVAASKTVVSLAATGLSAMFRCRGSQLEGVDTRSPASRKSGPTTCSPLKIDPSQLRPVVGERRAKVAGSERDQAASGRPRRFLCSSRCVVASRAVVPVLRHQARMTSMPVEWTTARILRVAELEAQGPFERFGIPDGHLVRERPVVADVDARVRWPAILPASKSGTIRPCRSSR